MSFVSYLLNILKNANGNSWPWCSKFMILPKPTNVFPSLSPLQVVEKMHLILYFQIKLLCLHHHMGLFIFTCHAYMNKHHIKIFSTQMHFLFLHTNLELNCFKFNYFKHKNYQHNKNSKGH